MNTSTLPVAAVAPAPMSAATGRPKQARTAARQGEGLL